MHHGSAGIGIGFATFHIVAAGGFLYFMYTISKSLRKIAKRLDKNPLPVLEASQSKQVTE